jgi:hypothetical protein
MAVSAMRLTGILPAQQAGGTGPGGPCNGPARCRCHEKTTVFIKLAYSLSSPARLCRAAGVSRSVDSFWFGLGCPQDYNSMKERFVFDEMFIQSI